MMETTEGTRKQRRQTKSFKGCKGCKAGKRKCSEERPKCWQCSIRKIECEYNLDTVLRIHSFDTSAKEKRSNRAVSLLKKKRRVTPSDGVDTPRSSSSSSPSASVSGDRVYTETEEDIETIATPSEQSVLALSPLSIQSFPVHPERAVEANDMGYFSFFLQEMVHIASDFKELFPTYIRDSFTYSFDNTALRHSVLAASAIIVDKRQGRDMVRFHHHRQQTYQYLRQQLASGDYDAPLTAAVFWTQYMDLIYGDIDAAIKHNHGLFLVLQHLLNRQGNIWQHNTRPSIPPLCMVIWRHGIRSDIVMSPWMNGSPMTFPPILKEEEYLHRGWMEEYARVSIKEHAADWAAASFALECFLHRACHNANDFIKSRVNGVFSPNIEAEFERIKQALIIEHNEWWDRPVIQQARSAELYTLFNDTSDTFDDTFVSPEQFLGYPPIPPIKNPLFAWLRNFWYANYIYISLFNYPPNLDRPHDPRRIEYAIEICRCYARTGFRNFPRWDDWCIIMAGVAFAENKIYDEESKWIYDRVNMHDGPGVSWPIVGALHGRMGELWGNQYFSWDDGKGATSEFGVDFGDQMG